MSGPVLIAIGVAMAVDIRLAAAVTLIIGAFKLLTTFPHRR